MSGLNLEMLLDLKTYAYLKLKIVTTVSNRFTNVQVDYAPQLVGMGLHSTIKQANEDIKVMNASISGYMSPYVSIHSKHTHSGRRLCIGKLMNNRAHYVV